MESKYRVPELTINVIAQDLEELHKEDIEIM